MCTAWQDSAGSQAFPVNYQAQGKALQAVSLLHLIPTISLKAVWQLLQASPHRVEVLPGPSQLVGDGGQMGSLQGQWGQMVQSQGIPAQGHVGRIARFQGYGNAAMPAQDVGNQLGQKPFPGSSYSHASGQADDASQPNLFSRLSLSAASLSQSVGSNTAGALSGSLATILEADHAVEDNWPDSNATWGSACSTAQRSTGHTPPVSHDSTADIGAHPAASTAGLAWGTAGGQSAFAAAGLPPRKKEGPESVFAKWDPDYQATAHQDLVY
ncbi:hypothetical protein WJX79_006855 [Trebouxia sp. C0005]